MNSQKMKLKLMACISGLIFSGTFSANAQAPNWLTAGNTATSAFWLGTNNTFDLIIKTNNAERMRILGSVTGGQVLIGGTTSTGTTDLLQLKNGNFTMDYVSGGAVGNIYLGGKPDGSQNGMRLAATSTTNMYIDTRTPNATTGLVFRLDNGAGTGATERMRINTNGKVGINCNNPSEMLQINNGILKLVGSNVAGGPMIFFNSDPMSSYAADWGMEYRSALTGGDPGLNFWKPTGSINPGNNYLFLSDNTHVGVNTNNPTAQLTVNGNVLIGNPSAVTLPAGYKLYVETGILTEKVKVAVKTTSFWSDYVFDKNYKLKSIEEVDLFVKQHSHLPGVPSAEEVVKDGIDMATMDAKLLEKIEELTLYIIEQNKRISQLEQKSAGQ